MALAILALIHARRIDSLACHVEEDLRILHKALTSYPSRSFLQGIERILHDFPALNTQHATSSTAVDTEKSSKAQKRRQVTSCLKPMNNGQTFSLLAH
jgi:hypothetical protein